jgi:hypothetical protein
LQAARSGKDANNRPNSYPRYSTDVGEELGRGARTDLRGSAAGFVIFSAILLPWTLTFLIGGKAVRGPLPSLRASDLDDVKDSAS